MTDSTTASTFKHEAENYSKVGAEIRALSQELSNLDSERSTFIGAEMESVVIKVYGKYGKSYEKEYTGKEAIQTIEVFTAKEVARIDDRIRVILDKLRKLTGKGT